MEVQGHHDMDCAQASNHMLCGVVHNIHSCKLMR